MTPQMPYRVSEAAAVLGVSPDTVRRWVEQGHLDATRGDHGRVLVPGDALASFARRRAGGGGDPGASSSARNRLPGIVTAVVSDRVMSEVEMQCGPFTVTSLMSTASVRRLGLQPGSRAEAVIKATQVVVDVPRPGGSSGAHG